jgi:hypothetical protein
VVIFAVSQKDMNGNARFSFHPKKNGSASFFQPYSNNKHDLQTVNKHAYMIVLPTFEFDVAGRRNTSATEIRNQFAAANHNKQTNMIVDLYGDYNSEIHDMMCAKIT